MQGDAAGERGFLKYSNVFLAASVAGTAQLVVATPVDVVKIKLQMQTVGPARYRGPWHCALSLFKTQVGQKDV